MSEVQSSRSFFSSSVSDADSITTLEQWFEIHPLSFKRSTGRNKPFNKNIATLKYPKFIESEEAIRLVSLGLPEDMHQEIGLYQSWLHELSRKKIEDEDCYSFQTWFMYILGSWVSLRLIPEDDDSTVARRKGVDNMIDLAFGVRKGAKQMWLYSHSRVL